MGRFTLDPEMAAAFAELSAAAARSRLFARKAAAEGKAQAAMVLGAIAEAEGIMARRAMMTLRGKIAELDAYLEEVAEFKAHTAEKSARRARQAQAQGAGGHTVQAYERFGAISRIHAQRLAVIGGGTSALHVCQVCGYIAAGEIPQNCPICNAVAQKFHTHGL